MNVCNYGSQICFEMKSHVHPPKIGGVVASSFFHETQWFFEVFEIPEMKWTVVWF
jgi:hypothetical protein